MSFTYNIPQPTDQLSVSQGQILANFGALGAIGGNGNASSAALNSTAGFNFIYLPVQSPAPTFPAGSIGLFSFLNPNTTVNELYVNRNGTQIPMTACRLSTNGWTYLPSGIKMAWFTANGLAGTTPYTWTVQIPTFPGFSPVFNAFLTTVSVVNATVSALSNTQVSVTLSGPSTFYCFAIGT